MKKYANLAQVTTNALQACVEDVRFGRFPEPKHSYTMIEGELPKLQQELTKRSFNAPH